MLKFWLYAALLLPSTLFGAQGVVVSENKLASQVGAQILNQGGNAIDAAVAVGYALAVVNPCCGNIGGGGFMTIHLANGKNIFVNFREKAPVNASSTMFLTQPSNDSTQGFRAVGVPGTVMGLNQTLKKYGTLPLKQVIAPAIKLARDGYILTPFEAKLLKQFAVSFSKQPNIAAIYLQNNTTYPAGVRLRQQNLAHTLTLIANQGTDVFYRGEIAQQIVQASKQNGGLLTQTDFDHYSVQELQPITCRYRGYEIVSAPPPSSGGITLCETLNILQNFPLAKLGKNNPKTIHYIVEALRYAFSDRNTKLGDPDFVTNPTQQLLSREYTQAISEKIKNIKAHPLKKPMQLHELTDTTHYSIIDNRGNAVATTYTLNGFFGAQVIAGNTGFFLNNEMDDFSTQPNVPNKFNLSQGELNNIQPGKRPLSSMTPTIVLKNGHVVLVLGSPGGPRIISAVLLTLLNVIDFHLSLSNAVNAPRYHFQGSPEFLYLEKNTFSPDLISQLKQLGYTIKIENRWAAVEAILASNNTLLGVNDDRRPDGAAISTN